MAVQDPQCCGLNGRSLKGNQRLGPDGGKAMLEMLSTRPTSNTMEDCKVKYSTTTSDGEVIWVHQNQVRHARHISLPLSWLLPRNPSVRAEMEALLSGDYALHS